MKSRALEQMRVELGMETTAQLRTRIVTFRKFAANKVTTGQYLFTNLLDTISTTRMYKL